jgi:hypothetical protein
MSNNEKNVPETGFRIRTLSSCSFYAQKESIWLQKPAFKFEIDSQNISE